MTATWLWGLFLISAIALTGLGLLLIILGIIQKKASKWVPGILLTVVAVIFCIAGLIYLIGNTADNLKCDRSYQFDNDSALPEYEDTYNPYDTTYNEDDTVTENENYITGFIKDTDKSLIHIKIIPAPELADMGIIVNKIDVYTDTGSKKKTIPLNINFSRKFQGTLHLALYSSDDRETGRSSLQISQNENSTFTVKFIFGNETDFLKTEYAHLKPGD
ncbi:MAG TPA: hypothetical protein PKW80_08135 [Bacteroidales bacterium]|nr:hypothetical protein [Bacteroidales bacterium]